MTRDPFSPGISLPQVDNLTPAWHINAACAPHNRPERFTADDFYPNPQNLAAIKLIKAFCKQCPVREQCLSDAIESGDGWGIWGALTERERHKITGKRRRKVALIPPGVCLTCKETVQKPRADYCDPCGIERTRERDRVRKRALKQAREAS